MAVSSYTNPYPNHPGIIYDERTGTQEALERIANELHTANLITVYVNGLEPDEHTSHLRDSIRKLLNLAE